MHFRSLLLLLPSLFLFSACDISQDEYASENWWCKFYGTCHKNRTASCSLYGNCPSTKKKDKGCTIWGCPDDNTDDGEDGDVGCSLYGNCDDGDSTSDSDEDIGCSLYGRCDDKSSEDIGCSLYGRCDDDKKTGWW